MAGPYVHCLVSREALNKINNDAPLSAWYKKIVSPDEGASFFPYVCLGSVSPDYPYPAARISNINTTPDPHGWTWGDKFHKQNTGNFIDIGVGALQKEIAQAMSSAPPVFSDALFRKTAWLMGYYSHIITDLVVHASVYVLVNGCYENHKDEHLFSEVTQDSLLFYDVYNTTSPQELVDKHFLRILWKCSDVSNPPMDPTQWFLPSLDSDVKELWDSILKENYSDFYDVKNPNNPNNPKIDDWHKEYVSLMGVATNIAARHLMPHMAYQKTTDIKDEDKIKCYSNLRLPAPDSPFGEYKKDVFDFAVGKVTERLKVFLKALSDDASYNDLKNSLSSWDLDKGTDRTPSDGNTRRFVEWGNAQTPGRSCQNDGT